MTIDSRTKGARREREIAADLSAERWRHVPGKNPLYEVSDCGRVRSSVRWNNYVLTPFLTGRKTAQYPTVEIDGKNEKVHRLVMMAFAGPPPEGRPEVNHIDSIRKTTAWRT